MMDTIQRNKTPEDSGIDTGSDQTDVDSPARNIKWKLSAIAGTEELSSSRRSYYIKTLQNKLPYNAKRDGRFLCRRPSPHWLCRLSRDAQDDNHWQNVDVQTLTNAWDKLNYLPEIKSEIELGEKLMNYFQVETC